MWFLIVTLLLSGLAIQYQYNMKDKALVRFYKARLDEATEELEHFRQQGRP
ncbi:MAG: hypothetical protein ACRCWW_00950 [Scandinavium sp.]|uniref:hypothetical protein n=1 Tax=Scandinavium sp. TaxID=2830653 RepID=UPI003F3D6158